MSWRHHRVNEKAPSMANVHVSMLLAICRYYERPPAGWPVSCFTLWQHQASVRLSVCLSYKTVWFSSREDQNDPLEAASITAQTPHIAELYLVTSFVQTFVGRSMSAIKLSLGGATAVHQLLLTTLLPWHHHTPVDLKLEFDDHRSGSWQQHVEKRYLLKALPWTCFLMVLSGSSQCCDTDTHTGQLTTLHSVCLCLSVCLSQYLHQTVNAVVRRSNYRPYRKHV